MNTAALIAVLAATSAWCLLAPPSASPNLTPRKTTGTRPQVGIADRKSNFGRIAVSLVASVAAYWLLGGLLGGIAAIAIAFGLPRFLAQLEPREVRNRRQSLEASAPLVADLLAACLASGSSPRAALSAVATALGGATEEVLLLCVAQLELGAEPARAWKSLSAEPALAPIARAVSRSAASGSPLAEVLRIVADEMRGKRRAELEVAARKAGIRAVGPLGACFLPAFMLLGVVPLVASLVASMIGSF